MTGTFPQAWEEVALVTVIKLGDTARQFMAITETIDIATGDYPGESMMTTGGGRTWKQSPEEDGEITLEMYPTNIATDSSNNGLFQQFAGGTWDTSQPLATDTSEVAGINRSRDRFMIAVMWTDDTAISSAFSATSTADKVALRFYAKECRLVSHKAEFTDGILKITATFKFPAMNQTGSTRCYAWESTDDGDGASALPALTYSAAL